MPAPLTYILATQLLTLLLIIGSALSFVYGRPWQGAASAINGLVLVYALVIFVGWRGSRSKLVALLRLPRRTFPILWAKAARACSADNRRCGPRKRKLVWAHRRTRGEGSIRGPGRATPVEYSAQL